MILHFLAVCGWLVFPGLTALAATDGKGDWKGDWEVARGFSLEIDVEGFDLPSAIAMVPNPGPNPKDPLYFVTELFGKVKVVTRDRSIYTFAEDFFRVAPKIPPPSTWGEIGMAGIVLDPANGYVFVSFSHHDTNGVLRNNIMRFKSKPGSFGLKAEGAKSFDDVLGADTSWVNYQVGPMVVDGNHLYVSIGDGGNPRMSQNLDFTTGKILRMTLDGKPVADNPYYVDVDQKKARNFVWASGFRNPFGLAMVNGRLFATENGIRLDRFLEVQRGGNYHWDGSDWSIGMNVPMAFGPTVGPVQLAWVRSSDSQMPEDYRSKFFMAMSYGEALTTGIAVLDYDFEHSRMAGVPERFVILRLPPGGLIFSPTVIIQKMVGVAVGGDALYIMPLYPVRHEPGAKGAVLRVKYDPANAHSLIADPDRVADAMMVRMACWNCHAHTSRETKAAPPLDPETLVPRILARLNSEEYQSSLRELDRLNVEPFVSYREARKKMMEAEGVERVRHWIKNRVKDPMFDRKVSAMPSFGLNEADAQLIADYLVRQGLDQKQPGVAERMKRAARGLLPEQLAGRHILAAVATGFVAAVVLGVAWSTVQSMRRRRRSAQ